MVTTFKLQKLAAFGCYSSTEQNGKHHTTAQALFISVSKPTYMDHGKEAWVAGRDEQLSVCASVRHA